MKDLASQQVSPLSDQPLLAPGERNYRQGRATPVSQSPHPLIHNRGVAFCPEKASFEHNSAVKTIGGEAMVNRINEVKFTDFHKFGSTLRILSSSPTE